MDFVPELNDKQLDRLSEFLSNTSLLSLASLVFPNIFGIDRPNMLDLTLGLGMTELQSFYLILAILLLAISILVAPTLWKRSNKKKK